MDLLFIIFLLVAAVIAVIIFRKTKAKNELQAMQTLASDEKTRAEKALSKLRLLSERLQVDRDVTRFESRLEEVAAFKSRGHKSKNEIDLYVAMNDAYQNIADGIEAKLEDPEKIYDKKYYDPLDDSVLTDPVKLRVNHPEKGPMVLMVNKVNAQKYQQRGPKAFTRRTSSGLKGRQYLVSGGGFHQNVVYQDSGFDLLDAYIIYTLFFDNDQHCMNDIGIEGHGGGFDGSGANANFGPGPDEYAYSPDIAGGNQELGTAYDEVAAREFAEETPIIAEPFADQNDGVETAEQDTTVETSSQAESSDSSGTAY